MAAARPASLTNPARFTHSKSAFPHESVRKEVWYDLLTAIGKFSAIPVLLKFLRLAGSKSDPPTPIRVDRFESNRPAALIHF